MYTRGEATTQPRRAFYIVGGVGALAAAIVLLAGSISSGLGQFGVLSDPVSLQDNWLIKLFKLNAASDGIGLDILRGVNPVDLGILAVVCVMYLGLLPAMKLTSKVWSVVAAVQPFLAVPLFLITEMQGRSAVMGSTLVASLVMLRSSMFGKATCLVGIVAAVLLLVGDFGTTGSPSSVLAVSIAIGYTLLTAWFWMVGMRLLRRE